LVPSRLGPPASIKQGRDLFPTHTQHVDVGQPTGEAPPPLAFGCAHVTVDAQIPMSAQRRTLRVQPLFRAGSLLGPLCARTAPGSLGLLSRPALPLAGHRLQHRVDDILAAMKRAQLMGPPAQDRGAGWGRAGRTSGGHAQQRQVPRCQGRLPPTQKGPDVLVGGIMVSDVIADALVTALIDRGEHPEGTGLECIGSDIPRKIRQGPVQELGVHARLRLFFPPPRPSVGSGQRARTRGSRARGANAPGGRAHRLRPRCGPPDRSPGGYPDCPVGPEQRGRRSSTCDTAYRNAVHRSQADPADTIRRDSPNPGVSDETAGPDRLRDHNAGTVAGWHGDCRGRSRAVAGLRGL
jgi:hypothetical protein